jgi:hypothetical protein
VRKYPQTFRMTVYPTRRTVGVSRVGDEQGRRATPGKTTLPKLRPESTSTARPRPFRSPRPASRQSGTTSCDTSGGGIVRAATFVPRFRPNGDYFRIGFRSQRIYAQDVAGAEPNRLSMRSVGSRSRTLRGTIFLVHEPVDQVAEQRSAWIYNAGARPCAAHRISRTTDQRWLGRPAHDRPGRWLQRRADRYDWRLLDKPRSTCRTTATGSPTRPSSTRR